MAAAAADNLPAFENLAERYLQRILRFAGRLTGSAEAAERIAEETLGTAFQRRKALPPSTKVSVLMYWTASKLAHQWLARNPGRGPERQAGPRRVAEDLDLDRRDERLDRAFGVLDDRDREILILTLFEGLTQADAATILNLPAEELRSRAESAYHAFRQELGESFFH